MTAEIPEGSAAKMNLSEHIKSYHSYVIITAVHQCNKIGTLLYSYIKVNGEINICLHDVTKVNVL